MTHVNDKPARDAAEVNFDSVARVASVVQLQSISLQGSGCSINVSPHEIPTGWATDAFVGFDTASEQMEKGSGQLKIHAAFIAVFNRAWDNEVLTEPPKLDPENPPEVEIHATFSLSYSIPAEPPFTDDDALSFAAANGTLHAWPYWREFADSMAHRMEIPRLMIGVFKLPSAHDPVDEMEPNAEDAGD